MRMRRKCWITNVHKQELYNSASWFMLCAGFVNYERSERDRAIAGAIHSLVSKIIHSDSRRK